MSQRNLGSHTSTVHADPRTRRHRSDQERQRPCACSELAARTCGRIEAEFPNWPIVRPSPAWALCGAGPGTPPRLAMTKALSHKSSAIIGPGWHDITAARPPQTDARPPSHNPHISRGQIAGKTSAHHITHNSVGEGGVYVWVHHPK